MTAKNTFRFKRINLLLPLAVLPFLGIFLLPSDTSLAQDDSQIGTSESTAEPSKQQVRELLLEILTSPDSEAIQGNQHGAEASHDQPLPEGWEEKWEGSRTSALGEHLSQLVRQFPNYGEELKKAFGRATNPETGWNGLRILITIILIGILGFILELVTTRKLLQRLYNYVDTQEKSLALKLRFIISRVFIQLIGVAVLGIVGYSCGLFFIKQNQYLEFFYMEFLIALLQFRLWLILIQNIFSPYRTGLRPIPIDDQSAKQLYFWFALFFSIIEFSGVLLTYVARAGLSEVLVNGLLIPYTLSLNLIILSQVWLMRRKITNMFLGDNQSGLPHSFARDFLVHAWPFMFTAWLLLLWMLWLFKAFRGDWEDAGYVSISWWITLAFLVADRIFHGFLHNIVKLEWLQSPTFDKRARRFVRILQTGFRLILIGFAIFMLSRAWGLQTDALMEDSFTQRALGQGINLLIIATIAYVVWELFNALIEKKLPLEEYDAIASLEGDGGGAGASRAETLLPLIRSCVTVVLVVFLLLSILHSLGIAITPLLAGAGVVGIALGFGAQKLVQDVLSGLFFLIDDAFRRGEYLELEGLRGTVEKISLRSMQLRHHLGAVQTVPYGEIKTVSNLSRDWITMKLELRLSYDTDIEAVRKIIKKVGQRMLEHEEYGKNFILPLKSQGVMRVEESALIVRMKFTSKPGEQWVIRREAYRQVRDALAAANIHFAHREVRVRLPESVENPQNGSRPEDGQTNLLTGAAGGAAAAMIAAEVAKRDKMDEEDDDGGDDR